MVGPLRRDDLRDTRGEAPQRGPGAAVVDGDTNVVEYPGLVDEALHVDVRRESPSRAGSDSGPAATITRGHVVAASRIERRRISTAPKETVPSVRYAAVRFSRPSPSSSAAGTVPSGSDQATDLIARRSRPSGPYPCRQDGGVGSRKAAGKRSAIDINGRMNRSGGVSEMWNATAGTPARPAATAAQRL